MNGIRFIILHTAHTILHFTSVQDHLFGSTPDFKMFNEGFVCDKCKAQSQSSSVSVSELELDKLRLRSFNERRKSAFPIVGLCGWFNFCGSFCRAVYRF